MPRPITLTVLLALALLLALSQAGTTTTYRTMTEAQAFALVRAYAGTIGGIVGADAKEAETLVGRSACENSRGEFARDGRFFVHGHWQMRLPAAEHPVALARLRDLWADRGYRIKRFKMFNEIEGMVFAENPSDEVELTVVSGVPPIAVAVLIITPCYRPPAASSGSLPG